MKKVAWLILFQFWFLSCNTQNNQTVSGRDLDEIVRKYVDNHDFSGVVFVANNGNILLNKGYGYADIEDRVPNTPTTNYFLASVSKLFTVACISDLKNRGLLNYDTPLSTFIPDYPNGNEITVRHLIKHESGIVDVVNERPFVFKKTFTGLSDLIDEFKYLPLNFSPGERSQYSNSGYILLAFIIENVSGLSYSEFIKKSIFEKLEMNNSFSVIGDFPINQAKGYNKVAGEFVAGEYFHPSQFAGSGNLSSTAGDMYKWYNGLYKTHKISTDNQSVAYGRIGGWTRTAFLFHSQADFVIIIMSNYGDAPVQEMGNDLTEGLWINILDRNKLSTTELKRFEGYYDYGEDGVMVISERKGHLYAVLSGQEEAEIYPVSENEFVWKVVDAKVKFENAGRKWYAIHNQNETITRAPRILPVELSTKELRRLEGEYDYGSDGVLSVREQNGRLLARLSNQDEFELFPISENEFFWIDVNARIKFEQDTQGRIYKAVHCQNGMKISAFKIK